MEVITKALNFSWWSSWWPKIDSDRVVFCPFCGKHMSRLTRFCWSLEFLNGADQTEVPDILQQCIQYFNEGHSYAVIVDMVSCLHGVHISLKSLKILYFFWALAPSRIELPEQIRYMISFHSQIVLFFEHLPHHAVTKQLSRSTKFQSYCPNYDVCRGEILSAI